MSFFIDIMHIVAATLLAIVGLGYEREEDCAPVHFQPAAYVTDHSDAVHFTEAVNHAECDSDTAAVVYPVL